MSCKRTVMLACLITIGSAVGASGQAVIEPASAGAISEQTPTWKQYCELSLREYKLVSPTNPEMSFQLIEKPAFVHVDELDLNGERGLFYVWTDKEGRSVAVITSVLMTWSNGRQWSELQQYHSLSDEPLELVRDGKKVWTPPGPALTWKEVPKASPPASRKSLRQLQAKAIARRFTARGESRKGALWNFRLMPRAVHSCDYADSDGKLVSGCLFIFCRATDPEVLLKLEVRPNKRGESRWHYGLGNFTNMVSYVSLDGAEIWVDDPAAAPTKPHGSHFARNNFNYEKRLKLMLAEQAAIAK